MMHIMALNIKNPAVDALVTEVARLANESKTEAVRRALEERKSRLERRTLHDDRRGRILAFLEREVWSVAPEGVLGRAITREEEDEILGFGEEGF